jgi:hypothetical protein
VHFLVKRISNVVKMHGTTIKNYVAYCCIILQCCVWLLTPSVFQKNIYFFYIIYNIYCRIDSCFFRPSSGLLWTVYIKHVRFLLGDSLRRNTAELHFRNWKQIQKYEIGNNNIIEVDFNFLFIIIPSITNRVPLSVRMRDVCLLQSMQTDSEGQKLT